MPDDPKRPLKVFLCHAHPDAEKVRALYARLKADGVDAWLDKENIILGQDWEMEIRKAVRESDIVVVCLSKQFSQKGYRQNEVRIALEEASLQPEGEIFIIPARLEECNYLESLKRYHGVDLFEERGYEYLMRALRLRADKIGAVLQSKKGWLGGLTPLLKKSDTQKPKPIVKPQPAPKAEQPKPVVTQKPLRKWNTRMLAAIAGVVVIFIAAFGLSWNQWFAAAPDIVTVTPAKTVIFTSSPPTFTFTAVLPTKTKTPTLTPTVTPLPTEITDDNGVEMVLVPVGEFTMGVDTAVACQSNQNPWLDCEKTYQEYAHLRSVFLDDYYIDKYEVTNGEYSKCLSIQQCKSPSQLKLGNLNYYGNTKYDNYPVVWVSFEMAKQYCIWRGAHLPSNAEWEKAARGTDQRIYPWGNESDLIRRANAQGVSDGFEVTSPVGSFPLGKSPYGALDMAGNVSEFVDGNITRYYKSGYSYTGFMLKGGDWSGTDVAIYSNSSYWGAESGYSSIGFRCASSAP